MKYVIIPDINSGLNPNVEEKEELNKTISEKHKKV